MDELGERCGVAALFGAWWTSPDIYHTVGITLIQRLIKNKVLDEPIFMEMVYTENSLPIIPLKNKTSSKYPLEIIPIDEHYKGFEDLYTRMVNLTSSNLWSVVDIIEFPDEDDETNIVTENLLVRGKNRSFIINIGYPYEERYTVTTDRYKKVLNLKKEDF